VSEPSARQVEEAIRDAARFLERAAAELAPQAAAEIHAGVPELPDVPAVSGQSTAGVRALIAAHARAVQRDVPAEALIVPEETLEHARMYVRRGIGLPVLLRTYRVGHAVMWRLWQGAVDRHAVDPALRLAVRDRAGAMLFGALDVVTGRVVDEYHAERERWSRNAAARRAEAVRDLLDGQPLDLVAASATLGRDLAGRHRAAILWTADDDQDAGARLERAAREVAAAIGRGTPLLVPDGARRLWLWTTPVAESPDAAAPAPGAAAGRAGDHDVVALRADGVSVALGEPGVGADGFRRSHREARAARALARRTGRPAGSTVRWQRAGLLGLLTSDVELARAFAARELGGLDADDDATARLRATLRTFLAEGERSARTAERLAVHPNTIANRLRQAEAALGRPLAVRRAELAAALAIRDGLAGCTGDETAAVDGPQPSSRPAP